MKMGKKEKSNGKNQEKPGSFSKVKLIIKNVTEESVQY